MMCFKLLDHISEQLQKPAPGLFGGVDAAVTGDDAANDEAAVAVSSSSSSSEPLSTALILSKASTLHLNNEKMRFSSTIPLPT
jgi:hypothetical protein